MIWINLNHCLYFIQDSKLTMHMTRNKVRDATFAILNLE